MRAPSTIDFFHSLHWADLPPAVRGMAVTCLTDLLGVAAAGSTTRLSRIVRDHAAAHFAAGAGIGAAPMLFDGRAVSPAGAALAGGMTIDAIDAHDGWRPSKGHAGCGLAPALLALAAAKGEEDGAEFLTRLVIGYETACRLGVALHASVPDYHTSGAWVAVAVAGLGARALGLDRAATRHALGIAEYHGPRSQMMRCIDHPTMLKDGSGWGAMAGISAAYLAREGFTGAPALTVEDDGVARHWSDLGSRWLILEQYFKPVPVCRWAQPAVFAAEALALEHGLAPGEIARVEVAAFHEATRLALRHPETTEQAQYSLPFPLAAALVRGRVDPAAVTDGLDDPEVNALADRVTLAEDAHCNTLFPERRVSAVRLVLADGRRIDSGYWEAPGDPEDPLSAETLERKFHAYADPVLGAARSGRTWAAVAGLAEQGLAPLTAELGAI